MTNSTRNKWALGFVGGIICSVLVVGFFSAVVHKGLDSSEAAGWMQALGALAAIIGAFTIAENQHKLEREFDKERARDQAQTERDQILLDKVLVVRNLVQVASQAQAAARSIIANKRDALNVYTEENYTGRVDALIAILDRFVGAGTDHVAVVAALNISMALSKTQADLAYVGGAMTETLLDKCDARTEKAQVFLGNLIHLQSDLLDRCRARGIAVDDGGEE